MADKALRCGRLVDVVAGRVLEDQLILIEGERVAAVGPAATTPFDGEPIDLGDVTVTPGLIDLHTHLVGVAACGDYAQELKYSAAQQTLAGVPNARDTLLAGFTTVRDVGTFRAFLDVALRDAIDAGHILGPRMAVAGAYVTVKGGGGMVTGLAPDIELPREFRFGQTSGVDDIRERVREIIFNGADLIKVIATGAVLANGTVPGAPELTEAQLRAAVEEASWYGRHVAAHAHGAEGIKRAIRAGVRSIEHACFLDDEGVELMAEHGTYLSADIWWADWISETGPSQGYDAEQLRKNDETAEAQRVAFAKAVKAGVKIGFGTDAGGFPHGLQGRQLATMVEYGMTPLAALRAATLTSAECMGWEDRVGSLTPGRYADLVAVPGELDIRKFQDVPFVMKGGTVVKNELG
ncbi:Xaa-Pro dipeptidase [Acrocarpospora phusangensis]|uniref:Xaa-Pro dipeptidase n=1 Tax=Acrocarpospora phusangensis TaxID=1070424 RepID=A0A919QDD8_9ACTN|nr:amidohydrolase family protein [Acrocarpospora phusangensis]GIH26801.1 Xaa-Pro dipeptidase [Acrocarpospora phusangensis]